MEKKALRENVLKKSWVFLYVFIYFPGFIILEHVVKDQYYLIECKLDMLIPFCEYFVIPYIFWFIYVAGSFIWFISREDDILFYKFAGVMFGGMTIALIIYAIFPNGIQLRPDIDSGKNICTWITSIIYQADTCTNVFPSLHVYTSVVIGIFFSESKLVKEKPGLKAVFPIISTLIVISTVFLKQHSVLDLFAGLIMAVAFCSIVLDKDADWKVRDAKSKTRVRIYRT